MPNKPYKLLIQSPDNGNKHAQNIWITNFDDNEHPPNHPLFLSDKAGSFHMQKEAFPATNKKYKEK